MSHEPQISERPAQPYLGLRRRVTGTVQSAVDGAFPELFRHLGTAGVQPAGPPFIRFLSVDAAGEPTELELAVPVDPDAMLPAAGQGALALEGRADDGEAYAAAAEVSDLDATVCVVAERALTAALDATCHTPVAALGTVDGDALTLRAFASLPDGSEWVRDELTGAATGVWQVASRAAVSARSATTHTVASRSETSAAAA